MNWIEKTLRAAHDKRFSVEIFYGSHWVGGYVREIDDETVVLQAHPTYGGHDFVLRLSAIAGVTPYPDEKESS